MVEGGRWRLTKVALPLLSQLTTEIVRFPLKGSEAQKGHSAGSVESPQRPWEQSLLLHVFAGTFLIGPKRTNALYALV